MGDVTHDKHDETTGKFAAEYSGEDFVDAVGTLDLPTTSDVADAVGCAHRTALHHLNRLEEEGRLDSRMAGRAKLWRVLSETRDAGVAPDAESAAHTARERSVSQDDRDTTVAEEPRDAPETGEDQAPLDDVLDDLPSTVDRDAAREAILAAREYLEKHSRATKADFVRGVMRDHPLGYDPDAALAKLEAGERFRGAWWRRVVKPGLKALDDVETPAPGASEWNATETEI